MSGMTRVAKQAKWCKVILCTPSIRFRNITGESRYHSGKSAEFKQYLNDNLEAFDAVISTLAQQNENVFGLLQFSRVNNSNEDATSRDTKPKKSTRLEIEGLHGPLMGFHDLSITLRLKQSLDEAQSEKLRNELTDALQLAGLIK